MRTQHQPARRRFLTQGSAGIAALIVGGCDRLPGSESFENVLGLAEQANLTVQRLLFDRNGLAPEYAEADIAANFKSNGTENPPDADYQKLAKAGFSGWGLEVSGLVERPARLTLAELRSMTSRTQITRHDCVEGWSCIGKWKGAPLSAILNQVGLKPQARYIVFHCADTMEQGELTGPSDNEGEGDDDTPEETDAGEQADSEDQQTEPEPVSGPKYYESIDLIDAYHPQTILAYEMNDKPLAIPYGAPLRLRVERQLGYKMPKYIMRIEAVDSFANIGDGKGGYWEDRGYDWYAGI